MTLSNLHPAEGAVRKRKRIGRGQGSGHGGTSTRGHKGQHSRTGAKHKAWFEGGQMPLIRRVPKFGFHSPFRVEFQTLNVHRLNELAVQAKFSDGNVTPEVLFAIGAISKRNVPVKILGDGDLQKKLSVSAHAFSEKAKEKITAAGGAVIEMKATSH
ncbi:MAG: 50S ribosomal protein L15 [Ignavibacteriales bacterium]|nr:50S ribosomal protein L15 [Ignavibacteriales bacterium]